MTHDAGPKRIFINRMMKKKKKTDLCDDVMRDPLPLTKVSLVLFSSTVRSSFII